MDVLREIIEAEKRIRPYINETPLEYSSYLSNLINGHVYLKLENLQKTGSFKIRGAFNSLLFLSSIVEDSHFITSSSGNHGLAFAYAVKELGLQGTIYLPQNTPSVKVNSLREYEIEIEFHGTDCVQTEMYARKVAKKLNLNFISPYNDINVIAGQGTIGVELENQLSKIDAVFVPIGGGGLISGISSYLKGVKSQATIIGCQPENSPVMYESIKAGKIIELESKPTLSDGTAGGIEPGSITFELCQKNVDEYELVTENEIMNSIKMLVQKHNMVVEGAAALAPSALMKYQKDLEKKDVVLIISGSKIDDKILKEILNKN